MRRKLVPMIVASVLGATALFAAPAANAASRPVCRGSTVQYFSDGGAGVTMPATTRDGDIGCRLRPGDSGVGVEWLQETLRLCYGPLNADVANLRVDGRFGNRTAAALAFAQATEKITPDGIYGPQTAEHLAFITIDGRPGLCWYPFAGPLPQVP